MTEKFNNEFRNLYGPWALVTGGTSGIGKAIAHGLAERGLSLIIVARDSKKLKAESNLIIEKFGIKVLTVVADLSTSEGIETVIQTTNSIDVGFISLSAGIENNGLFPKINIEKEMELLHLNVVSTMVLTHHFSKLMITKKQGGLLLISSLSAYLPSPYFANYAASKAYILSLGISLHAELQLHNVKVSVLSPGLTKTPMADKTSQDIDWTKTPMKFMDADTVAHETLLKFGKTLSIVPGRANKTMAFVAKHLMPFTYGAQLGKMMIKAINPDKI
jgi:short-subunit dehydrogenase